MKRVTIYDTTLRDGTQGEGFQLSVAEKLVVAEMLDDFGVTWIEGGWPGSNPRDEGFFLEAAKLQLQTARLAAFGSTRRSGIHCDNDPSIQALLRSGTPTVTIFGKSSRFHATEILKVSAEENLELIGDTVAYLKARCDQVVFDAEHFFDAADEDEDYALAAVAAAVHSGADYVALCDTNGGALPERVSELVKRVRADHQVEVGIHTHNDAELAVANALAAVAAGASMVQGTINGQGERCGNANLSAIIPTLELKMGRPCLPDGKLARITAVSRGIDEIANIEPLNRAAYVGRSAFAHKGGVHVNAVMKDARSYEHVTPQSVGNERRILVSDLSGRSNIAYKAKAFGIDLDAKDPATIKILEQVKELENAGYQFEGASASLRLLMEAAKNTRRQFFAVDDARVTTTVVSHDSHGRETEARSMAHVRISVGDESHEMTADGNGPVHALGTAFQNLVTRWYPEVASVKLVDYKVRILTSGDGVGARVRVLIRASDGDSAWGTVGVSTNVVAATWRALQDAYDHKLMKPVRAAAEAATN